MSGWGSVAFVELDGRSWTVEFAATHLGVSGEFLRKALKELEVEPVGVMRMNTFSRKGRQPRAYDAKKLIMISEAMIDLKERLKDA
jgi:hypothetical protein